MSKPTTTTTTVLPDSAPVWPGLLLASVLAAGLWVTDHQHWLNGNVPDWLTKLIAQLADWQLLVGLWFTVAALVTLAWDAARLSAWHRVGGGVDPAQPASARGTWVQRGLEECGRQLRERHAVDDFHQVIDAGHDQYARRLSGRWIKYYVIAFALPLAGFLFGLLNVRLKTTELPFRDLFLPVVIGTIEMGILIAGTVLLQRSGRDGLTEWQSKAKQLAPAQLGHTRTSPVAPAAAPEEAPVARVTAVTAAPPAPPAAAPPYVPPPEPAWQSPPPAWQQPPTQPAADPGLYVPMDQTPPPPPADEPAPPPKKRRGAKDLLK